MNVVIQTAFLGDLLLTIPLLKKIKKTWPNQKLFLVCRQGFGDFFLRLQLVDQCFEIKKGDSKSYSTISAELGKYQIDHLISPHESLRTAFFVRGLKARHKWGFKNWWSFLFYDQCISKNLSWPDALRQLSLMEIVDPDLHNLSTEYCTQSQPLKVSSQGLLPAAPEWASMNCRLSVQQIAEVMWPALKDRFDFLAQMERQPFVLIFPGSVWATKRWTTEGFIKLAQGLQQQGFQILLMGGPGEEGLSQLVAQKLSGAYDLTGKTKVIESAAIMLKAQLVVANDSASAHLAAVTETPVVGIFGPTVLDFGYRPWGQKVAIVENKALSCRPCGKHGHKECPLGTHECMKSIEAEQVLQATLLVNTQNIFRE